MKRLLSEINFELLLFIAQHQPLTVDQIERLFFQKIKHENRKKENIRRTLHSLKKSNTLSLKEMNPRARHVARHVQNSFVFHVTPQNYRTIETKLTDSFYLDETKRLAFKDGFKDIEDEISRNRRYDSKILDHDTRLSECLFMAAHQNTVTPSFDKVITINTSPKHADFFSTGITVTRQHKNTEKKGVFYDERLPFNTDGAIIYLSEYLDFLFVEYDNDSETSYQKYADKFDVYDKLNQREDKAPRELFLAMLQDVFPRYGIEVPTNPTFRVAFIVNGEHQRNKLLMRSCKYGNERKGGYTQLFNFCTHDDFCANPYAPIFYNRKSVKDFAAKYNAEKIKQDHYHKDRMQATVFRAWVVDHINRSTPVVLPH